MLTLDSAISETSHKLGIPSGLVGKIYRAYWQAIKQVVQSLPLKEDLTKEEFNKLRTSINIPSLGKLYSSYDRVQGVKKRFKYLQQIRNNDQNKETKTNVY